MGLTCWGLLGCRGSRGPSGAVASGSSAGPSASSSSPPPPGIRPSGEVPGQGSKRPVSPREPKTTQQKGLPTRARATLRDKHQGAAPENAAGCAPPRHTAVCLVHFVFQQFSSLNAAIYVCLETRGSPGKVRGVTEPGQERSRPRWGTGEPAPHLTPGSGAAGIPTQGPALPPPARLPWCPLPTWLLRDAQHRAWTPAHRDLHWLLLGPPSLWEKWGIGQGRPRPFPKRPLPGA